MTFGVRRRAAGGDAPRAVFADARWCPVEGCEYCNGPGVTAADLDARIVAAARAILREHPLPDLAERFRSPGGQEYAP